MQRVEIIARGEVQRVGFRDVVQKMGRELGLSGTVENQEPYDVRIVAEGQEDPLKEFVKALRIDKGPIQVRELDVTWTSATGEFPYFKILRGDWQEELGERFDVAVVLLHRSVQLGEENLAVGKMMLDKQDQMLDKQETSISLLKKINQDTSEIGFIREEVAASRIEARRGKDEIISAIKGSTPDEKYEELRREIAEIKAAIEDLRAKVS
jgi:acylphosphatase